MKPEAFAIWNDHDAFAVEPAKLSVWLKPDSQRDSPTEAKIMP